MNKRTAKPRVAAGCEFHPGLRLSQEAIDTQIECAACGAKIPASSATAFEGADYLWHFCGQDCLVQWCERVERGQSAAQALGLAHRDRGRKSGGEEGRIRFLLQRDGVAATIAWVQRTLRIYRAAVLDRGHFASSNVFRRRFIESYCDFKRWLQHMNAYGPSRRPSGQ